MFFPWNLQRTHLLKSNSMSSAMKPSKATFPDALPPGVTTLCKNVCPSHEWTSGSSTGLYVGSLGQGALVHLCICMQSTAAALQSVGSCHRPHRSPSPAGFSAHPALSPARSAVSAPSALASHTRTAAGSGPAAASPLSPRRLASLVTEQRRRQRSMGFRPVILRAGGADDLEILLQPLVPGSSLPLSLRCVETGKV